MLVGLLGESPPFRYLCGKPHLTKDTTQHNPRQTILVEIKNCLVRNQVYISVLKITKYISLMQTLTCI